MTDRLDFETRLGERLRSQAAIASRPFDAAMIARRAVAVDSRRRRIGPLGGRFAMTGAPRSNDVGGRRRSVGLLAAATLVVAVVGGAIAAGSGLVRLSPIVPPTFDATVTPGLPSPSPSTSPSFTPAPTPDLTPTIGSGSWSVTGAPRHAGCCARAILLRDGRVLLAGVPAADGNTATTAAQLYDPATGQWTETGRMHVARWGSVASLLADGRVLVAGGVDPDKGYLGPLASAELYDPATGRWTETGSMATWRWGSLDSFKALSLVDGRVLVLGGLITGQAPGSSSPRIPPGGGGETKGAETYDPETGTWSWARPMTAPPLTATLLRDGRVLVTHDGGSSELFDPRTGRWTATASTTQPVSSARATLLANGDVLLVGTSGSVLDGCPCTDGRVELYDPDTGSWTPTGSVPTEPSTAAFLADGIALVFGADGALRYDRQSGSWATVEAPPPIFLASPPDWPNGAPTYWPLSAGIAIRLLDGRVLAVGEAGGAGKSEAALFDPAGST